MSGYQVSRLEHSLQSATRVLQAEELERKSELLTVPSVWLKERCLKILLRLATLIFAIKYHEQQPLHGEMGARKLILEVGWLQMESFAKCVTRNFSAFQGSH